MDFVSVSWAKTFKGLNYVQLFVELHLRATECHLSYQITVLPATQHKWTHPALAPARQAGTRFTYLGEMEGRVDLGDWLHTEMVSPPTDGHPSKY